MTLRGCLPWIVLLVSLNASAQSTKTLSGRWSASTLQTSYTAAPWGAACGPKPGGSGEPGGIVTISQTGKELSIAGLGRNFSTTSCWEPISGGKVVGHSASERAWRTTCQSAPGDPRRSAVTTSLVATDDRIDFVEAGQFEFVIGGDTCHAVLQRSRTYSLVERAGESQLVPPTPAADVAKSETAAKATKPAAAEPPTKSSLCSEPGPPSRIEVSPTRKLLRPGDDYSFRVRVLDRNGCLLDRPVTWKAPELPEGVELSPKGAVKVLPNAKEGSTEILASIQGRTVKVTVDVVSLTRYQELLAAGTFNESGENLDQAVTTLVSSNIGTKAAVLENAAEKRRSVFIWTISAIAALLAGSALWIAISRRRSRPGDGDSDVGENALQPSESGDLAAGARAMHVCPTCHEEYPPERKYCAVDGNRLIAMPSRASLAGVSAGVCPVCRHGFDPGVTRCPVHDEELVPSAALAPLNPSPPVGRRICPLCGTIYGPEGQFCGNDGAALVPIN